MCIESQFICDSLNSFKEYLYDYETLPPVTGREYSTQLAYFIFLVGRRSRAAQMIPENLRQLCAVFKSPEAEGTVYRCFCVLEYTEGIQSQLMIFALLHQQSESSAIIILHSFYNRFRCIPGIDHKKNFFLIKVHLGVFGMFRIVISRNSVMYNLIFHEALVRILSQKCPFQCLKISYKLSRNHDCLSKYA